MPLPPLPEDLVDDAAASFHAAMAQRLRARTRPAIYGSPDEGDTLGARFVKSASFRTWSERFPSGGPTGPGSFHSDPMLVEGGLRTLLTSASDSAGSLVSPDFRGVLDAGLYRPPSILSLLTTIPTASDTVEFAREVDPTTDSMKVKVSEPPSPSDTGLVRRSAVTGEVAK
jgi:hypothetical protein